MPDTIVAAPTEVIDVTLTEPSQGNFSFAFSRQHVDLPNPAPPAPTSYTVQVNLITSLANTTLDRLDPSGTTPVPIYSSRLDDMSMVFGFTNIGLTEPAIVGYEVTALVDGTPQTSHDPEMQIPPPNG
jgi:hypothetical protein